VGKVREILGVVVAASETSTGMVVVEISEIPVVVAVDCSEAASVYAAKLALSWL
jgi:hypothetical protein